VFANRAVTFEHDIEGLGRTQDIITPRPWVIMQMSKAQILPNLNIQHLCII